VFLLLLKRDLKLALRKRADLATSLFFFLIVSSLFPLAIGPETAILSSIAPGVLWVAALLAGMLSLSRLFASDLADGSLEQMLLLPQPLAWLLLAKILAHWLTCSLPLIWLGESCAIGADLVFIIGYAGAEPNWCHRCRTDSGRSRQWLIGGFIGTATVYSSTHFRCRRSDRQPARYECGGESVIVGRLQFIITGVGTFGHGCCHTYLG
jgi:hypothetical protein